MTQEIFIQEPDLRCELGELRIERHELDRQIRETKAKLHTLTAQRDENLKHLKAVEKRLAHCSDKICPTTASAGSGLNLELSFLYWLIGLALVATAWYAVNL